MSEYWKSLPRKFCESCKCWFADNKASIEFHERGKRHQENVQKRIHDIQKKGIKDFKKQKKIEDEMAKIEKAALAAYKKDLQNSVCPQPEIIEQLASQQQIPEQIIEIPKSRFPKFPSKKKQESVKLPETTKPPKVPTKKWYEGTTEEGHKYYWNSETSESQWEPPEEEYVSLEEQNVENTEVTQKSNEAPLKANESSEESGEESLCAVGPQNRVDPYGQWVTVDNRAPDEIDFQLPKPSEDIVAVVIPLSSDAPKMKFREKVVGKLTDTDPNEEVTFKKRKFNGGFRRNARQRTADDD